MTSAASEQPQQEAADVAASWYVPPTPSIPRGWGVFSREYLLRAMQGKFGSGEPPTDGGGWGLLATIVQGLLAVVQALVMLLAWIPLIHTPLEIMISAYPRGSVGFFLRACYWKARLRALGQDTFIDHGVAIWGPAHVEIGARCHLDTHVRLAAGESGAGQKGAIRIGNFTHVGPRAHIAGRGGVTIGDFVAIEASAHLYSATNVIINPRHPGQLLTLAHVAPDEHQHIVEGPVCVEDYAMVGFAALILPGVTIGRGALVHPFTQVAKSFPPFANITGPGRARQSGWRRPLRRDPRLDSESTPANEAAEGTA